ncbi:hypothetical protein ACHAXR_003597, partial [Thalassiosira sp. AJA248-18]
KDRVDPFVNAMMQSINISKKIGLDAEWNINTNSRGIQIGRSKVMTIQIAYRDKDNLIQVVIIKTGKMATLPNRLVSLLCNDSIIIAIAGHKVSADLKYIGQDFSVDRMKGIEQIKRGNVCNLGIYARERDVVQNAAAASLELIAERTLSVKTDKSLQKSNWSGNLTDKQIEYAAIDAAVSLEGYEELEKMPDLSRRLKLEDIFPEDTYKEATLSDVGKQRLVVPISMLREHVKSDRIRTTPANKTGCSSGLSKPATESIPRKRVPNARLELPLSDDFEYGRPLDDDIIDLVDTDADENDGEYISCWDDNEDDTEEEKMRELTEEDITALHNAIFNASDAQTGNSVLKCKGLSDAPMPNKIRNRFSAVLGDIFHAINRTKVLVKHEAKKGFFVALKNAFLMWNPKKLKELEDKMRADGMSEKEIKAVKFFNTKLYTDCVDRFAPPPKILYWRVCAVYALYGNMVDSKSEKPLFNDAAWVKADNVLKEILCGYYSDPPGFNMYTKRLRADGSVMKNKYDMEMIECSRGTNRTEAYHKNLMTAFGSWHTGVEMSDYLLAERRHRHNHNISEKRRLGFLKVGHYDTWKIDQQQNLYLENHGLELYPYWTNASDYETTDESFDTVALHHKTLHNALNARCKDLGSVQLTSDQQYMCNAMGTKLPFLPFCGEDEYMQYAQLVINTPGPLDNEAAAVDWCKYVDGDKIHAKLPSQIRTHAATADRNQRVKECESQAKSGTDLLEELNRRIAPIAHVPTIHSEKPPSNAALPPTSNEVQPLEDHEF